MMIIWYKLIGMGSSCQQQSAQTCRQTISALGGAWHRAGRRPALQHIAARRPEVGTNRGHAKRLVDEQKILQGLHRQLIRHQGCPPRFHEEQLGGCALRQSAVKGLKVAEMRA
jgi:hypothetical protein